MSRVGSIVYALFSLSTALLALVVSSMLAHAQDPTAVCLAMVTNASHNVGVQTNSSAFLTTVYSNYCEENGSVKNSAFNAGLAAIVGNLPIDLTGGGSDTSTEIRNFCTNYQSTYAASSASFDLQSIVVQKALESANQCLLIVLLCHFLIHQRPLLPQTAGTSGQRFDQLDGKLTADACD